MRADQDAAGIQRQRAGQRVLGARELPQPVLRLAAQGEDPGLAFAPRRLRPGERERALVQLDRRLRLELATSEVAGVRQRLDRALCERPIAGVQVEGVPRGLLEVVGDRARVAIRALGLGQLVRQPQVESLTFPLGHALVRDVAQQVVPEAPYRRPIRIADEDLLVFELLQHLVARGRDQRQLVAVERRPSEDRRRARDLARRPGQLVEPCGHDGLDGRRQETRRGTALRREALTLGAEHRGGLHDEERIAAGVPRDPLCLLLGEPAGLQGELGRVADRQRLDPQGDGVGQAAGVVRPLVEQLPPGDAEHEQRDPPGLLREELHGLQQGVAGQVEILEHQHDRPTPREAGQEREEAGAHLSAAVAALLTGLLPDPERQAEPIDDLGALGGVVVPRAVRLGHELVDDLDEALADPLVRRARLDRELAEQHLGDRRERRVFLERARASPEHGRGLGQRPEELLHHPALADPGLPQQRHQVRALALDGTLVGVVEQRQLALPVDHRDPARRGAAHDAVRRPGEHGLPEPLRLDLPLGPELGEVAGQHACGLPHEHLAGLRVLLKPGGEVDLGPDHDVAVDRVLPDRRGPRVHPHADAQRLGQGQLVGEPPGAVDDPQPGSDPAQGVVVTRLWDPEHTHDGVAGEVGRVPTECRDLVADHLVEGAEHDPEPLGIQTRRELGRPHEVHEHDRDDLTLLRLR